MTDCDLGGTSEIRLSDVKVKLLLHFCVSCVEHSLVQEQHIKVPISCNVIAVDS